MSGAVHISKSFSQELAQLRDLIVRMGGMVENQLASAAQAVADADAAAAARAVEQDPAVDALEREVEQLAIQTLALRQPVADDLRQIIAVLKMSSDLERIGDYAANVAKRCIVLSEFSLPFTLTGFASMARLARPIHGVDGVDAL
jgi:phosphate transport system protein